MLPTRLVRQQCASTLIFVPTSNNVSARFRKPRPESRRSARELPRGHVHADAEVSNLAVRRWDLWRVRPVFFDGTYFSDPSLDFTKWPNRRIARFLETLCWFGPAAAGKQLILIFSFETYVTEARVQVYSDAALLSDQVLHQGDNQFAIVIDSPERPLSLYYIHAGGYWLFKGISGYLV